MLIFLCTLKMIFFQSVLEQTCFFPLCNWADSLCVSPCVGQEGDSLGAMEKVCRQLTYHLSPHSQWRRQGLLKRKPQAWWVSLCVCVCVCDCGTVCASVFVNISVCHRCVIICCLFGCHGEIFSLLSTLSCRLKHHIRCVALNNTILFFNWQQRQSHVTHILYTKYIHINCFFIGLRAERSTNDWTLRSVEGFYCSTHISTTLGPYLEEYFVSCELLNVKMSL